MDRHDDYPRVRLLPSDRSNGFEAGHRGELKIHQGDVRSALAKEGDGLFAVRRGRHHLHVQLLIDQRRHPLTDESMIVHAHHRDSRPTHQAASLAAIGNVATTSVPRSLALMMVNSPPERCARSAIVIRPYRGIDSISGESGSKPIPLSDTRSSTRSTS